MKQLNINIKVPLKLKVYLYKCKNFYIIKFINKFGVVKKKISSKNIIIKYNSGTLSIQQSSFSQKFNFLKLKKLKNIVYVSKLVIEQTILNMFKILKDRFVLEGIGFKVWKKKKTLKFKLGFSSPVFLKIPTGVQVSIYKQKKITISSINMHCMRIFGQKLKTLKSIDVYKRKGVRVWNAVFKLKVGKKTR